MDRGGRKGGSVLGTKSKGSIGETGGGQNHASGGYLDKVPVAERSVSLNKNQMKIEKLV